jgi:predicted enzyme related to lactoylglutathione lyase
MTMTHLPGKFVWFELVSRDAKKAQAFYGEVLGWKVESYPMGESTYEMIKAGDQTIGGYATATGNQSPHWISYVSVPDVDAAAKAAVAAGGKTLEPVRDMPTVGRMQRIADSTGAEICLFRSATPDQPDVKQVPEGQWFWNELATSDPKKAVEFYEKVVGYTTKPMNMGPDTYYVLEQSGNSRGGVTTAPQGAPSTWVPYVKVSDPDATLARAVRNGGKQLMPATDIPTIGRFAVFSDPLGAVIAVMNPLPM